MSFTWATPPAKHTTSTGAKLNVAGPVAPVRRCLSDLLPDVLDGAIDPGHVVDRTPALREAAEVCSAMDERRAIRTLLRPQR